MLVMLCSPYPITCPAHATSSACNGDSLVVGSIGEPSVLIPMLASDAASHDVCSLLFSGLLKYAPDLSLVGDLAESWEVSPDGLTIVFHLRKDVVWEDGTPCTAHDVEFGYKTIIDPSTPTPYAEDFRQIKTMSVLDPWTFKVTYEKPFAPALTSWGNLTVLPRHLLEGQEIARHKLTRHPIGLGPFKLQQWVPGEKLILSASQTHFAGRPHLDSYVFRFIPDAATLFLELQSGSIDLLGLTPMQFIRQTNTDFFTDNFQKFQYPVFSYSYLAFNLLHPWFQDKRVRQALAYAIDKQEIIDGVLLGLAEQASGPYVPNTWPYNPRVRHYPYDPPRARSLMAEAGWTDSDQDGFLDRDGKPFEFTILTNMGNPLRLKAATIIQWRLEMIGIKVHLHVLEWSTFINEFVDTKRFQALTLGWNIGLDPDQYDIWHSRKTRPKELNFVSYRNPEVDALLEQGRRTFNVAERKHAYFRIQEILAEDLPYIFLYVPYALPIVHARFHNIKPSPIGISYNIHDWFVPLNRQKYRLVP